MSLPAAGGASVPCEGAYRRDVAGPRGEATHRAAGPERLGANPEDQEGSPGAAPGVNRREERP